MGGCSSEREVSLRSGKAVADALREGGFDPVEIDITSESLPSGIDPARDVIFPVLHGGYGEGGGFQADLEKAGFAYAGCDSVSSRVCMDKLHAKELAIKAGVKTARCVALDGASAPAAGEIIGQLGEDLVIKPGCEGSSVGLAFAKGESELAAWLAKPRFGKWLIEERIHGRELTCGVLDGKAMGVVMIAPVEGVYDYTTKYTAGRSQYLFPAPISAAATKKVQEFSEKAFQACGCRDFSRIDYMLPDDDTPVFLEVNTLPGMTATSLLPKSASCVDLNFTQLVLRMITPAINRFESR